MGIFDLLQRATPRADVSWVNTDDRWYTDDPGAGSTFAGFAVTPDSAKRASAVFGCTSLYAEIIASLPRVLYRRLPGGGKEKARDHRLYRTIRSQPNRRMTAMDYYGQEQMRLELRGNAYSEIVDDGRTVELRPLHPSLVTVEELDSYRVRYEVRDPRGGRPRVLSQDHVLHVKDLSEDGVTGQARAALAREAIALAAAGEAFAGGVFRNDASGRLVLKYPGALPNEEERRKRREDFQSQQAGWRNRGKALHLYGGADISEVGRDVDGGFIVDPRKFQISDVARFWGVPGWLIGLEEKSTSWGSGIEQQMLGFVNLRVKARTDRWAQALTAALLDEDEQEEYFIEFNFKDLLRGDIKSRFEAYRVGREIGMYSPNDLLEKEDESPRAGGDVYQDTLAGTAPAAGRAVLPAAEADEEPEATAIPAPLMADAVDRLVSRERVGLAERAPGAEKGLGAYDAHRVKFFGGHRAYALKVLAPLGEAFGVAGWQVAAAADRVVATGLDATATAPGEGWAEDRRVALDAMLYETLTGTPPAIGRAA